MVVELAQGLVVGLPSPASFLNLFILFFLCLCGQSVSAFKSRIHGINMSMFFFYYGCNVLGKR